MEKSETVDGERDWTQIKRDDTSTLRMVFESLPEVRRPPTDQVLT